MYKILLALRYLRTRYIALASIISVTLGVATLIVVNSVMSGFSREMRRHLHDILSDIEVASPGLGEITESAWHQKEIRKVCGDRLEALTEVVRVPAMLHVDWRGRMLTYQVMLIGIDDETYCKVSDFRPYLQNEFLREKLSFDLQESGYAPRLEECGWPYRRDVAAFQKEYAEQLRRLHEINHSTQQPAKSTSGEIAFRQLPSAPPDLDATRMVDVEFGQTQGNPPASMPATTDPYSPLSHDVHANVFDPAVKQHTGVILGIALANHKISDPRTNEVHEEFIIKPGDDVQLTFPSAGTPPKAMNELVTVVDFYESKMHEYDSSFAFVPLSALQRWRLMVSPEGKGAISSIQIKLKPGVDLIEVRNDLQKRFPAEHFGYMIQTWQDTQRPLLSAAELELTILNILLFLIIAVAGFGILATFFMIVVEKTKDIGVLKSLGAPSTGIASIFLSYGLSLGLVGSGVGIGAGLLFVIYINDVASFIGYLTGRDIFDPEIYYFTEIPTIIDPFNIVWVAIGATLIAVMASVLPAIRAARLHPVEALRYE
jgi:lipoprotein-releasing system permease protein